MIPGFHLIFVAVHDEKHVVGGTEMGEKFLREIGSHVPHSFLGYLSAANSSTYVCIRILNFPSAYSWQQLYIDIILYNKLL